MNIEDRTTLSKEGVFRHLQVTGALEDRWERGKKTKERWSIIRDAYEYLLPKIMEAGKHRGAVCPYILDWDMTPIERLAWMDIRGMGLPLFPQFPVGRVFIDFGDPYRKLGVELDGAAYHERERDLARDTLLLEQGWRIFRIPGRVAVKIVENPFQAPEGYRESRDFRDRVIGWASEDSTGFFWALKEFFYRKTPSHKSLAYDVLSRFHLADFDLEDYG